MIQATIQLPDYRITKRGIARKYNNTKLAIEVYEDLQQTFGIVSLKTVTTHAANGLSNFVPVTTIEIVVTSLDTPNVRCHLAQKAAYVSARINETVEIKYAELAESVMV